MLIDKVMLPSESPAVVSSSDFGVRLDRDNIEQYQMLQMRAAKEWRDANSEEVTRVANFVMEATKPEREE